MVEVNGNLVTMTASNEKMIGFLWFAGSNYEAVPFETGTRHAVKSNVPAGTYIVKEYDSEGNVYDAAEVVVE